MVAAGGSQLVDLSWNANTEGDLAGYNLYRSDNEQTGFVKLNNTALIADTLFQDTGLEDSTSYFYKVSAVDLAGNESVLSNAVSATTDTPAPGTTNVWINEFHYDNKGGDRNEFVEVAGTAGTSLSGWTLQAYNGNGGGLYKTVALTGTIANQSNGLGTLSFAFSGLQNGSPDGIALVDNTGTVVQFLSYEGTFTATSGDAAGMVSEDIGVAETSNTSRGHSLQLGGTGSQYQDFFWQNAQNDTPGSINRNQSFN